jgi:hypothetical protein
MSKSSNGIEVSQELSEIREQLEKLTRQVRLAANIIEKEEHPYEWLRITYNLSQDDYRRIEDVFEEASHELDKQGRFSAAGFEHELRNLFPDMIGYQEVKDIVLCFHYNNQFRNVCREFAEQMPTSEMSPILCEHDDEEFNE